jgi:hypothetical protein
MTRNLLLLPILILTLALSACGTDSPAPVSPSNGADTTSEQSAPPVVVPSNEQYTSPNLDTTYENALSTRLQLALGPLMLDGTSDAISPTQAAELLPLWQALQSLTNSGTSATAETNALLAQIEATLTPAQINAIREMRLTQPEMQTWMAANGIVVGSGSGGSGTGTGAGGGGQGQGMSPEARATRQAEEGKTGSETGASSGASAALTRALLDYLQTILAE